jgi:signal transduction histidine kinase
VLLAFGLVIRKMVTASPLQQRQTRIVAIGALIPLAGNLAHILGVRTTAVDDPTPFLFAASGLLIFYAALRYQFPDPLPITSHALFASLPDGLVVLDQNGIVTALNNTVPGLLALATETRAWIGRTFQRIIAGSPLEIDLRALLIPPAAAASCRITYTHELGLRGVELRLRPLYVDDVRAGSLLVVRDRTDRAEQEQTIEQQMNALTVINRVIRAVNATLVVDDLMQVLSRELPQLLPNDRLVIGLLHPGGATLHRLANEQLARLPALDAPVATGNDFALLHNVLTVGQTQVIRVSEPLLDETAAQTILQQYGLRAVVMVPLASQSAPLGVLFAGHADDHPITQDEVQLFATMGEVVTEAIIRTRRSDQGHQAKQRTSTVLATITHELRTPLTSIIGFTDMLDQGIYGDLPEHVHEPLVHMRRNSQTLLRLINDILNFSKIEAKRFTIELAPVDLPAVIHDVVGAMQPQIQERGLALKLELGTDVPPVYANRERLEQVLTNLLANAIKFTDQGAITVRTTYAGEHVRFSVTDTGIGMTLEQQRVVFQEFQQIENVYQNRFPGTGLGLTISQHLMELMGGTLTVESTLGSGSTFSGDMPIVPETLREKEHGTTS